MAKPLAALLAIDLALMPTIVAAGELSQADDIYSFDERAPGVLTAPTISEQVKAKTRQAPIANDGAYRHSIRLDAPPGRNGMTPSVALSYASSSRTKDMGFGVGWALEIPRIERSVRLGAPATRQGDDGEPLYADIEDALIQSPSGELAIRPDLIGSGTIFTPVREHSPVVYEYFAGEDRWVERLDNGVIRSYGAAGSATGRIENELGTYGWLLLEEEDPNGNTIRYEYDLEMATAADASVKVAMVPFLRAVRWGGNASIDDFFVMEFEGTPFDGALDLLRGHVKYGRRLDKVTVFGPVPGDSSPHEYWRYDLIYDESPDSYRARLREVIRSGKSDGSSHRWGFDYTTNQGVIAWDQVGEPLPAGSGLYMTGFVDEDMVDHPDFVSQMALKDKEFFFRRNATRSRSATRFVDYDGDGRLDAIFHPAGVVAPVAQILPDMSHIQQDSGGEPQGGSGWFPLGGVLKNEWGRGNASGMEHGFSDLVDIDGDSAADGFAFRQYEVSLNRAADLHDAIADTATEFGMDERNRLMNVFCTKVWSSCCAAGLSCDGTFELPFESCPGGRCPEIEGPERFWYPSDRVFPLSRWFVDDLVDPAIIEGLETTQTAATSAAGSRASALGGAGLASASSSTGMLCGGGANMCASIAEAYTYFCPDVNHPCSMTAFPMCDLLCEMEMITQGLLCHHPATPSDCTGKPRLLGRPVFPLLCLNAGEYPNAACGPLYLDKFPVWAEQAIAWYDRHIPASGNLPATSRISMSVLSDIFAPTVDINADGLADIAMFKYILNADPNNVVRAAYKFEPRIYLQGEDLAFSLDDDLRNGTRYTWSAISHLANGDPYACFGYNKSPCVLRRPYPQSENVNTLLVDVNGDGLTDLVAGTPWQALDEDDPARRYCVPGHQVYLNTGYDWDQYRSLRQLDPWSTPVDAYEYQSYDAHPWLQLRNHQNQRAKAISLGVSGVTFCSEKPENEKRADGGIRFGFPASAQTMGQADLNADGLVDYLFAVNSRNRLGWFEHDMLAFRGSDSGFVEFPLDAIGLPRRSIGCQDCGARYWALSLNESSPDFSDFVLTDYRANFAFSEENAVPLMLDIDGRADMGRLADLDADGLVDLVTPGLCKPVSVMELIAANWSYQTECRPATWYRNLGVIPDLLGAISEPSGSRMEIDYVTGASAAGRAITLNSAVPSSLDIVKEIRRYAHPQKTPETIKWLS